MEKTKEGIMADFDRHARRVVRDDDRIKEVADYIMEKISTHEVNFHGVFGYGAYSAVAADLIHVAVKQYIERIENDADHHRT